MLSKKIIISKVDGKYYQQTRIFGIHVATRRWHLPTRNKREATQTAYASAEQDGCLDLFHANTRAREAQLDQIFKEVRAKKRKALKAKFIKYLNNLIP